MKRSTKRSTKEVRTFDPYLTIFVLLEKGFRPSKIAEKLNLPKTTIQYYVDKLKNEGSITKKGYGVWEVRKEVRTFSRGMKEVRTPYINLHALEIKIPIIKGKIRDSDWEIKNKLNNWLPKYKNLEILGGLTIRNNNNKSLSVFIKSRNIKNLDEVDSLAFKVRAYIFEYFKHKHGVVLDVLESEVKNINLATEDKHSEGMIRKGEKFEVDLNKKAQKIFTKDQINAKAWVDGSPFTFSVETNDKEWKKAYLDMPFNILGLRSSLPALEEYNKNILLHMDVQRQQLKTQKDMQKTQIELQKTLSKLSERLK